MKKTYELYKKDIDRTLLIQNLKRTPEERVRLHMGLQRLVQEARKAKFIKKPATTNNR